MTESLAKNRRLFSPALIFALIVFVLLAIDIWLVVSGLTQAADERVMEAFYSVRSGPLTAFFRVITFCGNTYSLLGLCILVIILPGRMKIGVPVALMVAVGSIAQTVLKAIVARPRPDQGLWLISLSDNELYQSFPSGHANASLIFWLALAILLGRSLTRGNRPAPEGRRFAAGFFGVIFVALAMLIAVSRLYLGVHYATDVLGGWLLAGLVLILGFLAYDRLWPAKWRL